MKEFIVRVIDPEEIQWYEEEPETPELIRCNDCKHKPFYGEWGLEFPDNVCPCQNSDDDWYSYMPDDDWFCPRSEPKDGDGE